MDSLLTGSVFHKILYEHISEVSSPEFNSEGRAAINSEIYLYSVADDIISLYREDLLNKNLLKRLNSSNDGEVRGAIYEISIAAAFVRMGYKIKWISDESRPEFTATKDDVLIDVEAKRRDRHNTLENGYDIKREIRAIRQNITKALNKKRTNLYLICLDSDLPPAASFDNKSLYDAVATNFGNNDLKGSAILLTNNGYEYLPNSLNRKDSALVVKDSNAINDEVLKSLIRAMHDDMPDAVSDEWPIA